MNNIILDPTPLRDGTTRYPDPAKFGAFFGTEL